MSLYSYINITKFCDFMRGHFEGDRFMDQDKCINTYNHYYGIMQHIFTILNILGYDQLIAFSTVLRAPVMTNS